MRLRNQADLARETLIHDLSVEGHDGFASWDAWLEKAGVTTVATKRGMRINNSAAVLQAAIDGHGVALARSVMARDDLAAGRLVRLFPEVEFTSRWLTTWCIERNAPACPSWRRSATGWSAKRWRDDQGAAGLRIQPVWTLPTVGHFPFPANNRYFRCPDSDPFGLYRPIGRVCRAAWRDGLSDRGQGRMTAALQGCHQRTGCPDGCPTDALMGWVASQRPEQ